MTALTVHQLGRLSRLDLIAVALRDYAPANDLALRMGAMTNEQIISLITRGNG